MSLLLWASLSALSCTPAPEVEQAHTQTRDKLSDVSPVKAPRKPLKATNQRAPRPKAAAAPRDALHLIRTTGSVESPIPYTIVAPAKAPEATPIVIALHGRGDRAEGFSRLVERLRLPMRFIVGEAPMRWAMGSGKQWFDMKAEERAEQIAQRVKDIVALKDKVQARWPKAPKPLLLGFSQGAMLALQIIAKVPEHFRGAVALSGALIETDGLEPSSLSRPLLLSAGSRDRIIRPEESQKAAEALRALGHQVELFRFEGGHSVPQELVVKVQEFLKKTSSDTREGVDKK